MPAPKQNQRRIAEKSLGRFFRTPVKGEKLKGNVYSRPKCRNCIYPPIYVLKIYRTTKVRFLALDGRGKKSQSSFSQCAADLFKCQRFFGVLVPFTVMRRVSVSGALCQNSWCSPFTFSANERLQAATGGCRALPYDPAGSSPCTSLPFPRGKRKRKARVYVTALLLFGVL